MRDLQAPPLSSSLGHFRAEVDRRAEVLGRHHRRTIGSGLAVVAVVVLAVSSVLVAGSTTSHQTTSSAAARPQASVAGGNGTSKGGAQGRSAGTLGGAASGPSDVYVIAGRPSGFVGTGVLAGMNVTVTLPAPSTGQWGRGEVTTGNRTVLTFFEEAYGAEGVQVTFKAHRLGTAIIAIPLLGDPAGSWHATIVVTGTRAPDCSPDGVCH